MSLSEFIFNNFAPIPSKQWKQKIQYELKGADYQKELVITNIDGISSLPYYTQADNKELINFSYTGKSFKAIQINVLDAHNANQEALKVIKNGANSIYFIIFNKEINTTELLKNITAPVVVNCQFLNVAFAEKIHQSYSGTSLKIITNPIGKLLKTGNWYRDTIWDLEQLQQIINFDKETLTINMSLFHNAGATGVQQLAYTIGQVIDYSKLLTIKNCKSITYQVSVNTDLYTEISKLKALRILHESLIQYLGVSIACSIILEKSTRNLHAIHTNFNQAIAETEQLIGFAGGANLVTNLPKDTFLFKEQNNQYENSLHQFLDTDYSKEIRLFNDNLYIEKNVQQLVSKTISLIENIEQGGGFLVQFKKGIIRKKIEQNAQIEQKEYTKRFSSIINGDLLESRKPIVYPFFKFQQKQTQYKPIVEKRLSAPIEKPIWDRIFKND